MKMKNLWKLWLISSLLCTLFLLVACGSGSDEQTASPNIEQSEQAADNGEHAADDDEHVADDGEHADNTEDGSSSMEHEHVAAPDEFASLTNPLSGNEAAIASGQEIFATNCVVCHGETGKGDGAAAVGLDPKPADLSDGMMLSRLSDGYLYWRVSKGGMIDPFNSAMPAWENSLTEEQRWQVISFIRTLADENGMGMGDEEHMDDDGEHSADE